MSRGPEVALDGMGTVDLRRGSAEVPDAMAVVQLAIEGGC